MRILAVDVGTSSVKAAILNVATAQAVSPIAELVYALDHPTPDAAEVPTDRLWSVISAAAQQATRGAWSIDGVGLSCLTPALVLLDEADRPLRPIWTHLD